MVLKLFFSFILTTTVPAILANVWLDLSLQSTLNVIFGSMLIVLIYAFARKTITDHKNITNIITLISINKQTHFKVAVELEKMNMEQEAK